MKVFEKFEAVKFSEENLIFITKEGYLYYIFNPKYDQWSKHKNAGNDHITVSNYQEISREELTNIMGGKFPTKETDFTRLCNPEQLRILDMMNLLKEDYPLYMSPELNWEIYHSAHELLLGSDICHKTYSQLRKLFDDTITHNLDNEETIKKIRELSFIITGRDIFKEEIGIVDGHEGSSYFWIRPVRVYEFSDTNDWDTVAEMKGVEISIEEDDIDQYLTPFLYKYFDDTLEANAKRVEGYWTDDNGVEHPEYIKGFEWWLTHNFYTYEAVENILKDIRNTIDVMSAGNENEYTSTLREKRGWATYKLVGARNLTKDQIDEYNANRPTVDDTDAELIIDFYQRFIYRMEYMMRVGKEKGYNLISFMGP